MKYLPDDINDLNYILTYSDYNYFHYENHLILISFVSTTDIRIYIYVLKKEKFVCLCFYSKCDLNYNISDIKQFFDNIHKVEFEFEHGILIKRFEIAVRKYKIDKLLR